MDAEQTEQEIVDAKHAAVSNGEQEQQGENEQEQQGENEQEQQGENEQEQQG